MITFICWKWTPAPGYRSSYAGEQVNVLRRMVARHYDAPHRFVCVTDDATGIGSDVEVLPLWSDFSTVPSPHGLRNPSCYRRLKAFARDAAQIFGERFVSLDLDTVIVNDLRPLFDRPEDFVIWENTTKDAKTSYNGSMWMLTAGARPQVWETFDPKLSPKVTFREGRFGSDQAWISHCLGPHEVTWNCADGVYSYRVHISRQFRGSLPANARIVFFHGKTDPWDYQAQQHPWVRAHYR